VYAVYFFVGFCPVYAYNHFVNYINCSHFERGCPDMIYGSKDVYKRMWQQNVNVAWAVHV
jgi:hypothetical protein